MPTPSPTYSRPKRRPDAAKRRKVHELFAVTTHRWPGLPSAREMGITSVQRCALIRIRLLYGRVTDELSYSNTRDMMRLVDEAETLMQRHFPGDWKALQEKRALATFPNQQAAPECAAVMAS